MFVYRRLLESQVRTKRGHALHDRVIVVMADKERRKGKRKYVTREQPCGGITDPIQ